VLANKQHGMRRLPGQHLFERRRRGLHAVHRPGREPGLSGRHADRPGQLLVRRGQRLLLGRALAAVPRGCELHHGQHLQCSHGHVAMLQLLHVRRGHLYLHRLRLPDRHDLLPL
jgi:hypothetical protein